MNKTVSPRDSQGALLMGIVVSVMLSQSIAWGASGERLSLEPALVVIANNLSPSYALYLYESLTRQVLSNERLLEKLDAASGLAEDSLWALDIMAQSIIVENEDGQYVDVRRVPPFFVDIAQRYLSASHYWPDQEITNNNRREHLAAWYSIYLMVLVANATNEEIVTTLRDGMFNRTPEGLEEEQMSLLDRLHRDQQLTDQEYTFVHVNRSGPAGQETLTFPAFLDQWKSRITAAYGVKN